MKNTLTGCLLLLIAFAGGLLLGAVAAFVVEALTGNEQIGGAVGGGVLILGVVLFLSYGCLLLYSAGLIRDESPPTSSRERWRKQREERKLQTAELRVGFIFAVVGGGSAHYAGASTPIIVAVAVALAALGGLIGHDIRRRAKALREKKRTNTDEDSTNDLRSSDL